MHTGLLVSSLSKLESTNVLNKLAQLLLDIHFVLIVDLKADILNWILFKGHQIFLASDEEREGDVEENGFDLWLDHQSGLLELQALTQKLD